MRMLLCFIIFFASSCIYMRDTGPEGVLSCLHTTQDMEHRGEFGVGQWFIEQHQGFQRQKVHDRIKFSHHILRNIIQRPQHLAEEFPHYVWGYPGDNAISSNPCPNPKDKLPHG